jgi:ADP-dependent NAD(P)H-hydrate dehydratase
VKAIERIDKLPAPPARPDDAHKGTFGRVVIIAGSEGMSGAACLSGYGALRGGAGLVTLAIPRSVAATVAAVEPSWLTRPLADVDGRLSADASPALDEMLDSQTVVAIGPGLGQSPGVRAVVQRLYETCALPLVVDADGLNAWVGSTQRLGQRTGNAPRVLTPHPGEFARLTGRSVATDAAQREACVAEFAAQHRLTLLLKGPRTVVSDGARLAVNATGNSGMATAGSGDVLTGLIASLLAQGLDTFDAARLGAHLHGLAGDCAAQTHGGRAMIASDIHAALGAAWERYLAQSAS